MPPIGGNSGEGVKVHVQVQFVFLADSVISNLFSLSVPSWWLCGLLCNVLLNSFCLKL